MRKHFLIMLILLISLTVFIGCAKQVGTPSPLTAAQIIDKSSQNMQGINSFYFVLDQSGGGTPIAMGIEMQKASGDVIKPDKLKMTINGTYSGMALQVQMITVSGVIYMTNPLSGQWEIPPAEFDILKAFNPNAFIVSVMQHITDLAKLSDEQSGGVICYHLSGSINSDDLSTITGSSATGVLINVEVWVGKDDLLLRTVKLTGKITETEALGIIRTLSLSNFNEGISIELPK